MKKHLPNSLRALFLSLAVLLSLPMLAVEVEIDGIWYNLNAEAKQATVVEKRPSYSGEVVIPESVEHESTAYSVTSIGERAFSDCYDLTSVTIGNSVTSIGYQAFCYCSGLASVTIPNSVTSIGAWVFEDCSSLTSVTIPNSVTSIGHGAFSGCSSLPVVDNIRYADSYLVEVTDKSLSSYKIKDGTRFIGDDAFFYCSSLTSVTIPNSVTSIGNYAFYYCSGLTSVTIGNSVTSIGWGAFYGCSGLTSVTIPNSVTSIGDDAFYDCSGLTSVTIGNSVESIGGYAFRNCDGLTSVTIPNSVTSIGNDAFSGCSGLTEMKVDANNSKYDSREGCNAIIETSSNTLISACQTTVIPNSVTTIGTSAFSGCSGLTSVTIPNSVTSIGGYAFSNCDGLTSVSIPNSVMSIGDYAFYYCSGLQNVYCYAEKVPSTSSNTFNNSNYKNATLHVPTASIESYQTTEPWSSFGTITALVEDLTLADGEEFENVEEKVYSTLTYTRTLPNLLWNPLYVPFKIPYEALEENYEVAYINAMHSYDNDENGEIDEMVMEIVKIKAGTLKPNHPYLIKAKNVDAKKMSIVQENATLYPAEITTLDCSSVYTKFEITGTYQKMTSEKLNGSLVISTDGSWKKLSSSSTLKPFRFYLTISSREGSPVEISEEAMSSVRISVRGEFGNATGVDEVNAENGKQKSEIYDLSGRRVNAPAKGGVYIINGKKMIY